MKQLKLFIGREPAVPAVWIVTGIVIAIWMFTTNNLNTLSFTITMSQKVPLALATVGAAVVIMGRGIDLSVGAVLTIVDVIVAAGTAAFGNSLIWVFVGIGVALAAGILNGFCVAYLDLPPLIVTLGTQSILLGLALYILPSPGGRVDTLITQIPLLLLGPIPVMILLLIGAPLVVWYPLRRSPYGTALLASGGDAQAAYSSGIQVRLTVMFSYVVSAFFAGLAGIVLCMNTGSGDAAIGIPYTMNTIAASVMGGVALSGGRGTVVGPMAGALLISFIGNFLFGMGVSTYWQYVVTGTILILAICIPLVGHIFHLRREVVA